MKKKNIRLQNREVVKKRQLMFQVGQKVTGPIKEKMERNLQNDFLMNIMEKVIGIRKTLILAK